MTPLIVGFTLAEKLAIVQALDSVIHVDGTVHNGEINAMSELMNVLDFDSNLILQARNLPQDQGLLILRAMNPEKKKFLAIILDEVANSDGHFHEKEMKLILSICATAHIQKKIP